MSEILTEEEIITLTELLKKIKPGFLPLSVFIQIARIYVTAVIEIVPLYNGNGVVKVLLQERDVSDPVWGGALHTAGSVIRATDESGDFRSAIERILQKELKNIELKNEPTFVKTIFHQVKRGRELGLVFYIELKTDKVSNIGELYNIDNLPDKIVDTQIQFIKDAGNLFKNHLLSKY